MIFSKAKICKCRSFDGLEKEINALLIRGYVPSGTINYLHSNNGANVYTQLMVKVVTDEERANTKSQLQELINKL